MIEFLKLCGFSAKEIESELTRVEKAFNKLGISAEDIEVGKQRLAKYYDIELQGVRKMLRLVVKEVLNAVLSREEGKTKIIYGLMASGFSVFGSALLSMSKEVYAIHLSQQFQFLLGCIFNKFIPVLEAAETKWLQAGLVTHCSNVKAGVGLIALDVIPKPDLMVASGYLCDIAPKTVDLIDALYDIPGCCYDTCQDRELSEYRTATKRIGHFSAESLRRFVERVQKVVGFEITHDILQEVMDTKGALVRTILKLEKLIENSDPLVLLPNNQALFACVEQMPLSVDKLQDITDAVNTLYEELLERVNKGLGVLAKGVPRILAINPTHFTDPRLDHLIGEMGMAIVSTDLHYVPSDMETSEDFYERTALANVQRSLPGGLSERIALIIEACKRLNVVGVLDRYHVGCRSVGGDAFVIKDAITKELGIPVTLLEWDDFDPRVHNHEQYKKKLGVFKTMLQSNR